uniref:DNA-dependent metalloprotease SPRTN n=1 Tax=Oncorhynchus tshawytscha TaxID=74940 RepID=A0A8C8M825_ONCTS
MDDDFLLAIQLQDSDVIPYSRPSIAPEKPMSIVDESWETLDPSPDVRAMFLEFNDTFFWGKLSVIVVSIIRYDSRRGGLCSIRLSEPLLKLRPRRDLVQTLLHEMIHALLFVTLNNRDRDGHGPEFCKHMDRINQATGTKITVYHTFHDEVDLYRQHWWRCDGPCRTRKPYFGYVKRAMNRAPSAQDTWWGDHLRSCGGTYTKVKEPEGYGKKGKKTDTSQGSGSQDIRNIIPFSGKGFLLGGSSQPSSFQLKKPIVNSPTTPFTTSVSPRLVLSPPAQATAKGIDSPGRPGLSSGAAHGPFRGPKPPVKKSVSNTKAFVNIGGSPVRIYKSNTTVSKPDSNSSDTFKTKTEQRSVQDLFNASVNIPVSRKRPWEDRTSAHIFDFFQQTIGESSPSTSRSTRQDIDMPTTPTAHPAVQNNSASSASPTVNVSCPVCQAMVQESKINQHLDSCLL